MQPAHALLAIAGNQRPLDRAGGAALRTRGQALLPAGFPHSVFHDSLFSDDYYSMVYIPSIVPYISWATFIRVSLPHSLQI